MLPKYLQTLKVDTLQTRVTMGHGSRFRDPFEISMYSPVKTRITHHNNNNDVHINKTY